MNIHQIQKFEYWKGGMLHQLLFALLGKPGAVFILDEKTKTLMVDRSLPVIKDHQKNVLNEIVQIGTHYRALSQLISKQTDSLFLLSNNSPTHSSTYGKAIAFAMQQYLKEYQSIIISIENDYLENNKHFTISNIMAELMKYRLLFPELIHILTHVFNDSKQKFDGSTVYGGAIIDYLYQKYLEANQWVRQVLKIILCQCYKVFTKQINEWILFGEIIDRNGQFFVHRVTWEDAYKKFKESSSANIKNKSIESKAKRGDNFNMKRIEGKNIEITDWDMYTLEVSMIPKSFIKQQTAGKVLFIGKSIKILKSCGKIPILPERQTLEDAKRLIQSDFQSNVLEEIIEKIRKSTAQKMINLIIGEQNLLQQLEKLNDYYLMTKGDFYHLLLEQSLLLDKISPKEKAVTKLNDLFLPNTYMRLNSDHNSLDEDSKKVSFELRPFGFKFDSFKTFNHLCPVGNIDLVDGKSVKFNSSDGALWCKSKQNVENGFTMSVTFKFRKNPRFFKKTITDLKMRQTNVSKAVLSIVFQNSQEVSTSSHSNPYSLRFLEEYLSIDIGFVSNEKKTEFGSFMTILAANHKNGGKPFLLGNMQLKKMNLNDEHSYNIKVSYTQDSKLMVSLVPALRPENKYEQNINIGLSIPYYLNLEMGRANVGFISNLLGSDFGVEIEQWEMRCTAPNHFGDHWSDICLHYKVSWPLDLILTSDIFENYSRVHKFLFPIRQTQIQIDRIWHRIPRRIKEQIKAFNAELPESQLRIFQRKLSILRSRLSLFLSQLWKYCQEDIKLSTWYNFSEQIKKTDDFELLIALVNRYIKSIQSMFFFSIPKVQNNITGLVRITRNFTELFERMENEKIDQACIIWMEEITAEFDNMFKEFVDSLGQLSNTMGPHHLYHLTERMKACWGRREAMMV